MKVKKIFKIIFLILLSILILNLFNFFIIEKNKAEKNLQEYLLIQNVSSTDIFEKTMFINYKTGDYCFDIVYNYDTTIHYTYAYNKKYELYPYNIFMLALKDGSYLEQYELKYKRLN